MLEAVLPIKRLASGSPADTNSGFSNKAYYGISQKLFYVQGQKLFAFLKNFEVSHKCFHYFTKPDWEQSLSNPWSVANVDNGRIPEMTFPPPPKENRISSFYADLIKCPSRKLPVFWRRNHLVCKLKVLETQMEFNFLKIKAALFI